MSVVEFEVVRLKYAMNEGCARVVAIMALIAPPAIMQTPMARMKRIFRIFVRGMTAPAW
jgi:hypothetical protein